MSIATSSPCPSCRKINRVPVDASHLSKRPICGSCKEELTLRGAVNELSASGLQALIDKSPVPVVADFWAPWCAPCKVFAPVFEQAALKLAGEYAFAKVDTEAHPLAGNTYAIRSIPTLVVFNGGLEITRQSGAMSLPLFLDWIRKLGLNAA
jgi:thioredoxin 2